MPSSQPIVDGKVVSLHYTLTLDDGEVVDSSRGQEPMSYLHGSGAIVPGLERGLSGRAAGETVKVSVPPEDAYGEREDAAIQVVDRAAFPPDEILAPGQSFQAVDDEDNAVTGRITAVDGDAVTIDFNHPLAGETLHFEVEITGVRDASAEERHHGHVHGPGGHHHH